MEVTFRGLTGNVSRLMMFLQKIWLGRSACHRDDQLSVDRIDVGFIHHGVEVRVRRIVVQALAFEILKGRKLEVNDNLSCCAPTNCPRVGVIIVQRRGSQVSTRISGSAYEGTRL